MKLFRVVSHLCVVVALLAAGTAAAKEEDDAVLALGDSVVLSYIAQDGYAYVNPDNFIGYPDYVADALRSGAVNASCPGETTGSFLSSTAADNGCRAFRAAAPLHVAYDATQLDFATSYLKHHRDVRLVTLGLGANDGLLLLAACASAADPQQCIQNALPGALQTVASNIATILADLRAAGFGGTIVIANYFSTDYSDASTTGLTVLVNQAISAPASAYGAVIADVFAAFQKVAANPLFGGKTCHAGLLNAKPQDQSTCDDHPSQSGQRLIARTVGAAYEAAK